MDIIERLNDPELYVDAIDDAIHEIEKLRKVVKACNPAFQTAWPHNVYSILANRNSGLADHFGEFMQAMHAAMWPIVGDKPFAMEDEKSTQQPALQGLEQ
jgi:hypothetical protein